MFAVRPCDLPQNALLKSYGLQEGCYVDCYSTPVRSHVDLSDYVYAFYTTPLFKLERIVLRFAAGFPSTDAEARQLASAGIDRFAAWTTEKRSADQLLMCDVSGRTRSWFMVEEGTGGTPLKSRLYFGSAVVPKTSKESRSHSMGFGFNALLGFHKLYSRALLTAAKAKLER